MVWIVEGLSAFAAATGIGGASAAAAGAAGAAATSGALTPTAVAALLGVDAATGVSADVLNLINGPLGGFFSSGVGLSIARAMASASYTGLLPYVGPQFAALAFAVPAVLQGKPIIQGWTDEVMWRLKTTAQILVGQELDGDNYDTPPIDADTIGNIDVTNLLQQMVPQIQTMLQNLQGLGVDPSQMDVKTFDYNGWAQALGIRADAVAQAVALYTGDNSALSTFCANAQTGFLSSC